MIAWGISSIKMFVIPPQNIIDLAELENGAWKIFNPAKFDSKILKISILAPDNTVNTVANLKLFVNQLKNSGLMFSPEITTNANITLKPIGNVKNIKL